MPMLRNFRDDCPAKNVAPPNIFLKITEALVSCGGLSPEAKIILGFSSGGDSVFLLQWLAFFLKNPQTQLKIVYLNHQLRMSEVDDEIKLVQDYAQKLGVNYRIKKIPVRVYAKQKKCSEETAGRLLRRQWLGHEAKLFKADAIMLAHHLDDACESFFMQLFRGAKVGLSGIRPRSYISGIPLLRPLLSIAKKEILETLYHYKWKFSSDSSNLDPKYQRNLMRTRLANSVEIWDKNYAKKIDRTIKYLQTVEETFDQLIEPLIKESEVLEMGGVRIERQRVLENPTGLQAHFWIRFLQKYILKKSHDKQLCDIQIQQILKLSKRGYGACSLPENYKIIVDKDWVTLSSHSEIEERI